MVHRYTQPHGATNSAATLWRGASTKAGLDADFAVCGGITGFAGQTNAKNHRGR